MKDWTQMFQVTFLGQKGLYWPTVGDVFGSEEPQSKTSFMDQLISSWRSCFPTELSAAGAKRGVPVRSVPVPTIHLGPAGRRLEQGLVGVNFEYFAQKGRNLGSQVPTFLALCSISYYMVRSCSKKQLTPKRLHYVAAFATATSSKPVQKLLESS